MKASVIFGNEPINTSPVRPHKPREKFERRMRHGQVFVTGEPGARRCMLLRDMRVSQVLWLLNPTYTSACKLMLLNAARKLKTCPPRHAWRALVRCFIVSQTPFSHYTGSYVFAHLIAGGAGVDVLASMLVDKLDGASLDAFLDGTTSKGSVDLEGDL